MIGVSRNIHYLHMVISILVTYMCEIQASLILLIDFYFNCCLVSLCFACVGSVITIPTANVTVSVFCCNSIYMYMYGTSITFTIVIP